MEGLDKPAGMNLVEEEFFSLVTSKLETVPIAKFKTFSSDWLLGSKGEVHVIVPFSKFKNFSSE